MTANIDEEKKAMELRLDPLLSGAGVIPGVVPGVLLGTIPDGMLPMLPVALARH